MQRLPVHGQRPLQFALVGVQIPQLQQRPDPGVVMGCPIAQSRAVQLGALVQDGGRLLAAPEGDQRRAQVEVGHWKKKGENWRKLAFFEFISRTRVLRQR